jgi:hypothetical protein
VIAQLPGAAYAAAFRAETGVLTVHFSFALRNECNRLLDDIEIVTVECN